MAKASAAAKAPAAPQAPKGMKMIQGGFAKTWNVDELPVLEGSVQDAPKEVTLNKGTKKETVRRCVEVKTKDGDRFTVWESAALAALFDNLAEEVPCKVWISFRGYGTAKKGQNAPKLFDSAIG